MTLPISGSEPSMDRLLEGFFRWPIKSRRAEGSRFAARRRRGLDLIGQRKSRSAKRTTDLSALLETLGRRDCMFAGALG